MKRYFFIVLLLCVGGIYTYYQGNNQGTPASVTLVDRTNELDKINIHNPSNVTCLINKEYSILDSWQPSDLVTIENELEGTYYLRKEAADSWNTMHQDAKKQNVNIFVISSYRTKEYQEKLYNKYLASDPVNAPYYSAKPRASEHELGLAIDISYDQYLHQNIQETEIGKWMHDNAYKYGWVMRYPDQKTDITGYVFESWHYRYVGKELATILKTQDITLEEYYQK